MTHTAECSNCKNEKGIYTWKCGCIEWCCAHPNYNAMAIKHNKCWGGGWNPANTPVPPSITRCQACGSFQHIACSEVKFWVGQRVRVKNEPKLTAVEYLNLVGTVIREDIGNGSVVIKFDKDPYNQKEQIFTDALARVEPLPQAQQQVTGAQVFSVGQKVRIKPKEQLSAEFTKTLCSGSIDGESGIVVALDETFKDCSCLRVDIGKKGEWYVPVRDLIPGDLPPGAYTIKRDTAGNFVLQACGCTGTTHVGTCSNFPKPTFRVPQYPTPLPPAPQEPCDTCGLTAPCFCKGLSLHATMPAAKEWEFPQVHP